MSVTVQIGNATVTNGESAETDVVATDDVMTPMQKTVEMVEKKARNLEKRKVSSESQITVCLLKGNLCYHYFLLQTRFAAVHGR